MANDDGVSGANDMPTGVDPAPRRRRWPWIVGVSFLVVGLVAGISAWLVMRRPGLLPGERYGIDVSNHQGEIDWERVAADGIDFAYIKVSEGGDWTDQRGRENWAGAAAAGLERGGYHFFTLCTPGAEQARHFLASMPDDPEALPPSVDLELGGNCSDRPPEDQLRRELDDFLEIVESETGQEVLLYVGDDFESVYPVNEVLGRPLWLQRFVQRPETEGWWIWQVSGFARVDGVDGRVDLDVMRPLP